MSRLLFLGSGGAAGSSLLLDMAGWTAQASAWGLAKLRSAYAGNAVDIQRSSDSTTQAFGFSGNLLDTASILAFVGSGNGDIVGLYDQGTQSRKLTTTAGTTAALRLVSSGVLNTLNGKPVGIPTGAVCGFATAAFTAYTGTTLTGLYVGAHGAASDERMLGVGVPGSADYAASTTAALIYRSGTGTTVNTYRAGAGASLTSGGASTPKVYACRFDGTTETLYNDATTATAAVSGAWGFTNVLLLTLQDNTGATDAAARFHCAALDLADVGATNMSAIISAQQTAWGGI